MAMPLQHKPKDVWISDLGDGTYRNPIIHSDYSDPDVIRVGSDFYMVASSFAHVPGLPVLHSKDLVNWTIINHIMPTIDLPGYDRVQHGKAVWAPSIRYHNGKYWVYFGAPDEGILMSTADDPFGEWTPLHMVKEVKGWIDTCPFWDDDGNAYLVHAFAKSRCGIKHKLKLCRMSSDGKTLLDEGQIIFDGTEHHPTMEGPKMYKRNGYYYIFAPAGGVSTGWQTILRSRSIYGPYEDQIVLHQGDSDVNGPHQGGWVELESGESWFVHFQDRGAYGRIVHLQPVHWVNDWPLMGEDTNGDGIGEPVKRWTKPNVGASYPIAVPATSDDFDRPTLGLQWQWQANPQAGWYSLQQADHLRLYAAPLPEGVTALYDAPNLLMQKFPAPVFSAAAKMYVQPGSESERAGLIVFGEMYSYLAVYRDRGGQWRIGQWTGGNPTEHPNGEVRVHEEMIPTGEVYLKVSVGEGAQCRFLYSTDGVSYRPTGQPFTAKEGKWVGAKFGLFASSMTMTPGNGYADFDWIVVEE